jgi:hypothetical protein
MLWPSVESPVGVTFGQCLDDLLSLHLELVRGQGQTHKLPLQHGEEEKVSRSRIKGLQGMGTS